MVQGSEKTFGELAIQAASMTGNQQVGEITDPLMSKLKGIIEDCVQKQYEVCLKKGFTFPKYYIHIFITKDLTASNLFDAPNVIRIKKPHCRVTRPSPYQDEDHYLWSVENGDKVTFEWCIPNKETLSYILKHPNEFDKSYVRMLRKYSQDKLEKLEDYMVNGEIK